MAQNTSHAIMAQRREAQDSLDFFPTPPWATRALLEWLSKEEGYDLSRRLAWEPACGEGHMLKPLREYFASAHGSDIHDYGGIAERITDFLFPGSEPPHLAAQGVHWIITNPPFKAAEQFIDRALELATVGAAFLVRTAFLEGIGRYNALYSKRRPFAVLQFSERVPMHKGKLTATGSTATAYCWLVFLREPQPYTRMEWIGPCRRKLERPGDYEPLTVREAA